MKNQQEQLLEMLNGLPEHIRKTLNLGVSDENTWNTVRVVTIDKPLVGVKFYFRDGVLVDVLVSPKRIPQAATAGQFNDEL